ncbi:hypothetical protein [Streptomyces sp. NPDC001020]
MTFALHAFLGPDAPEMSNESLAADLRELFEDEAGFTLQWERLPFSKGPTLALRWGAWLTRVAYEESQTVAEDARFVHAMTGGSVPIDLSAATRRVRVVFGDDDAREYTDQIISLMDYLSEIKGAIVYDPQQADVLR